MSFINRLKNRRGVALIFALFTAALLVSMSATVVALAISHSRDSGAANYSEAAIHAANYGVEAAVNYMGDGSHWETTKAYQYNSTNYNYPYGSHLKKTQAAGNPIAEDLVSVVVSYLGDTRHGTSLADYGLAYKAGDTVGEDTYTTNHNSSGGGDTRIITFRDNTAGVGEELKLYYQDGTFAKVKVACTELRYPKSNQPSQYQLVAVSRVYRPEVGGKSLNATKDGYLLATRVIECRVREQTAADFMHFIQNARSWDVTGVNLATNEDARGKVYLPTGYKENGRLRVDGINKNKENNSLKKLLADWAGTLGFFVDNGTFSPSNYQFAGDVTTQNSEKSFVTNQGSKVGDKDVGSMFGNSLHASEDPLGLPQADNYFDYARAKANDKTYGTNLTKVDVKVATGNNSSRTAAYTSIKNARSNTSKCPDVVVNENVPSFAVTRVILGDSGNTDGSNQVTVIKYNPAMYSESQIASLSPSSPYVEKIFSGPSTKINNGVIAVEGGNVEVVSAASASSRKPACFTGNVTVVSDVEATRDTALNSGAGYNDSSLYSDMARRYYNDNPYVNIPPYTETQLKNFAKSQGLSFKTTSSNPSKTAVWPTPVDSSVEREGNVYISSDIAYGQTGSTSPSVGIVAKNFILLNDRNGDDNLRVDAVLMSHDHSVQFDWNNQARNSRFSNLTARKKRTFTLNGAIVSGYLDVEADANYRGYYTQNFQHDENLRYQLPPIFPRWDRSSLGGSTAWNWVILSYQDNGTINDF